MNRKSQLPKRKSTRLNGHDYRAPGVYFITICTDKRAQFFGSVKNGKMMWNEIGNKANELLQALTDHHPHAKPIVWIVMPNHIHLILLQSDISNSQKSSERPLLADSITAGTQLLASAKKEEDKSGKQNRSIPRPKAGSVSTIIQQFKASVKRWCNQNGYGYFRWQGRFHEHIARDKRAYQEIYRYIVKNPEKWAADRFHS